MRKALWPIVAVAAIAVGIYYWSRSGGQSEKAVFSPSPSPTQEATGGGSLATSEAKALIGTWRSTEDSKFTREFRVDGSVIDKYEGDEKATSTGIWYHIIYPERESFEFSGPIGATFIKLAFDGEPFYFEVSDRTENSLTLIYLTRGNLLHFTRVK